MTEDMLTLARRAVTCKAWRWTPGMADQFGRRVMQVYPDELGFKWSHLLENNVVRDADALPDLTDPATLGCFLALVRKAWCQPLMTVRWSVRGWSVVNTDGRPWCWRIGRGSSEAEALVVALEAAP